MKTILSAAAIALSFTSGAYAEGVTHHVAIHMDQNDPKVMNMALNNVQNINAYYESQGDTVVIELVTYGPGLNMLIAGKSPVEDRISTMSLEMENLTFAACGNTHRKMSEKSGTRIALLDEAEMVPSGVVRLIELQENGYAYVRP
ncbi:MAG: DsrE family protein [Rhodobacteraceae bacterium]|nr:DsrE family protein [Paracoccaceae bacterium]